MAIEQNYNTEQGILTFKAVGNVSVENVEMMLLSLLESDEFSHDVDTIWDIRELSFEYIDLEFIKKMVAMKKKYDSRRGDAKIAILSNYALAAPIIKLYVILSKGLSQKTNVFKSIEEAEYWLCKDKVTTSKNIRQLN